MKKFVFFITVFSFYSHCCSGVPSQNFGDSTGDNIDVQKQQERSTCYLRVKLQCTKDVEMELMIGDEFSRPEFVAGEKNRTAVFKCIPVPCGKNGKVTGNILVIGNELTAKPELLRSYSAFTSEEQCQAAGDQKFAFDITCETDSKQLEMQGAFDHRDHSNPDVNESIQGKSNNQAENQLGVPDGDQELTAYLQWQNGWDGPLRVVCPNQHGFHYVRSIHDNGKEDRLWQWHCKRVAKANFNHAYWTNYVNWFDQPIFHMCNPNYILCGVYSYHNNGAEDRRWNFKCCRSPNHYLRNCGITGYVNGWDSPMNYKVGASQVITGVYSYHDNGKEDRLWKFGYCELKHCVRV